MRHKRLEVLRTRLQVSLGPSRLTYLAVDNDLSPHVDCRPTFFLCTVDKFLHLSDFVSNQCKIKCFIFLQYSIVPASLIRWAWRLLKHRRYNSGVLEVPGIEKTACLAFCLNIYVIFLVAENFFFCVWISNFEPGWDYVQPNILPGMYCFSLPSWSAKIPPQEKTTAHSHSLVEAVLRENQLLGKWPAFKNHRSLRLKKTPT